MSNAKLYKVHKDLGKYLHIASLENEVTLDVTQVKSS